MARDQQGQNEKTIDTEADLDSRDHAGENRPRDLSTRTAYDMKDVHDYLRDLPDSALKQIPILETGAQLDEGATYLDLAKPEAGEFTGMNNIIAGPDEHLVDKSTVDYELWNRLIGVEDPYRLGRFAA